ncbi:hypothetical protein M0811_06953 [Anaeramoeba ignava]|uniref:Uncharacterized protein n=1 Tax=Anaeramoeba ignava TaxID=1746090 RepID=A0A9Q0RD25_ANAIG|nr:hypothetical protein M0811_06953 [Anaeramoeba ignava]
MLIKLIQKILDKSTSAKTKIENLQILQLKIELITNKKATKLIPYFIQLLKETLIDSTQGNHEIIYQKFVLEIAYKFLTICHEFRLISQNLLAILEIVTDFIQKIFVRLQPPIILFPLILRILTLEFFISTEKSDFLARNSLQLSSSMLNILYKLLSDILPLSLDNSPQLIAKQIAILKTVRDVFDILLIKSKRKIWRKKDTFILHEIALKFSQIHLTLSLNQINPNVYSQLLHTRSKTICFLFSSRLKTDPQFRQQLVPLAISFLKEASIDEFKEKNEILNSLLDYKDVIKDEMHQLLLDPQILEDSILLGEWHSSKQMKYSYKLGFQILDAIFHKNIVSKSLIKIIDIHLKNLFDARTPLLQKTLQFLKLIDIMKSSSFNPQQKYMLFLKILKSLILKLSNLRNNIILINKFAKPKYKQKFLHKNHSLLEISSFCPIKYQFAPLVSKKNNFKNVREAVKILLQQLYSILDLQLNFFKNSKNNPNNSNQDLQNIPLNSQNIPNQDPNYSQKNIPNSDPSENNLQNEADRVDQFLKNSLAIEIFELSQDSKKICLTDEGLSSFIKMSKELIKCFEIISELDENENENEKK